MRQSIARDSPFVQMLQQRPIASSGLGQAKQDQKRGCNRHIEHGPVEYETRPERDDRTDGFEGEAAAVDDSDGETAAVYGDAVADAHAARDAQGFDGELGDVTATRECSDRPDGFDDPGEHRYSPKR